MSEENRHISVTVKFFADFRDYGPEKETLEVPIGSKIQYLLDKYDIPYIKRNLVILVNGLPHKKPDEEMKDGDVIAIFPPIAGG